MQELIVALTRAANAVAVYYEKSGNATLAQLVPVHEEAEPTLAPAIPKKIAAKKPAKPSTAEPTPMLGISTAAAGQAFPVVASAPVPTAPAYTPEQERESTTELYKLAGHFIQKTTDPEEMETRRTLGMEKMKELFGVETIKDLSHTQRLGFIHWLKVETAKA